MEQAGQMGGEGARALSARPASAIVWPRQELAGCVFCTIVRDTRGVALTQSQRFNFFPASPLCCISWLIEGEWHLVETQEQMVRPWNGMQLARTAFSGAQLGPLVSWNPGQAFAITVAFYPDAFATMTGTDLGRYVGRMVPVEDVLPDPMLELCRALPDAVRRLGLEEGCAPFERAIARLWSDARHAVPGAARWLKDWSRSLVARAAMSGAGRSSRQIARRIKAWTGVSERDLEGLGNSEQLYARIHKATQSGQVRWSEVAADSGFADQAHMIRQMKRHTGFTPEQLRRCAPTDEALWAYRLLGQYFAERPTEKD